MQPASKLVREPRLAGQFVVTLRFSTPSLGGVAYYANSSF